jgi:hypothetical protein
MIDLDLLALGFFILDIAVALFVVILCELAWQGIANGDGPFVFLREWGDAFVHLFDMVGDAVEALLRAVLR